MSHLLASFFGVVVEAAFPTHLDLDGGQATLFEDGLSGESLQSVLPQMLQTKGHLIRIQLQLR